MGSATTQGTRSRRGGVPTALPAPAGPRPGQLSLLGGTDRPDGPDGAAGDGGRPDAAPTTTEVLPGVVHVAGWLGRDAQRHWVREFRTWALPPAGLRHPRVPTGHLMTVQSVCLGWHWYPYAYTRTADDTDGAPVKPLPTDLAELGRDAVRDTFGPDEGDAYAPDAAIVNLYAPGSRLGLHQDGEEPAAAPVVTVSLGDTATFRLAGVDRRTGPFTDVELRSGDLLVFGGPNRRIFHGVPKVADGTGPEGLGLPPGRLSITLRETGLG